MTPHIGAEIFGVDLSRPLGNQQFQEVHDALLDRLVIFFRDQKISIEQHKDFGRRFGKLHMHPASPDVVPDHPEVLIIKADEKAKYIPGEDWHSNVSCDPEPPMGSIPSSSKCPRRRRRCTMFANMYLALRDVVRTNRKLIDGLTAVHDGEKHYRSRYGNDDRGKIYPRAEHSIVRTHPETGRKCLFVNRFFTTSIVGLRKSESDAILEMLYRQVETPELSVRFKWQPNSVAFWDNRCTQHHALWDYYPHRRYGHRVTVSGQKPLINNPHKCGPFIAQSLDMAHRAGWECHHLVAVGGTADFLLYTPLLILVRECAAHTGRTTKQLTASRSLLRRHHGRFLLRKDRQAHEQQLHAGHRAQREFLAARERRVFVQRLAVHSAFALPDEADLDTAARWQLCMRARLELQARDLQVALG